MNAHQNGNTQHKQQMGYAGENTSNNAEEKMELEGVTFVLEFKRHINCSLLITF